MLTSPPTAGVYHQSGKYRLDGRPRLFSYHAGQGVAPTLVYPVPSPDKNWLISKIIHSIRDYYPLWQVRRHDILYPRSKPIYLAIARLPINGLPVSIINLAGLSAFTFEAAQSTSLCAGCRPHHLGHRVGGRDIR